MSIKMEKKLTRGHPFRIADITINKFSLIELDDEGKAKFDQKSLVFRTQPLIGSDEENRIVRVQLIIKYAYQERDHLVCDISVFFEIHQSYELVLPDKKLFINMLALAHSISRGVIFSMTSNSFFRQIHMPVITPEEIIDDMFQ